MIKVLKENVTAINIKYKLLAIDVRTRWNSSLKMLIVFNDLMPAVKKTLLDYGYVWHDYLETSVPLIILTLNPCKMTMDDISHNNSNLNMADPIE